MFASGAVYIIHMCSVLATLISRRILCFRHFRSLLPAGLFIFLISKQHPLHISFFLFLFLSLHIRGNKIGLFSQFPTFLRKLQSRQADLPAICFFSQALFYIKAGLSSQLPTDNPETEIFIFFPFFFELDCQRINLLKFFILPDHSHPDSTDDTY